MKWKFIFNANSGHRLKLLTEPFNKSFSCSTSPQEQMGKFGQTQLHEYFFFLIKIPNEMGLKEQLSDGGSDRRLPSSWLVRREEPPRLVLLLKNERRHLASCRVVTKSKTEHWSTLLVPPTYSSSCGSMVYFVAGFWWHIANQRHGSHRYNSVAHTVYTHQKFEALSLYGWWSTKQLCHFPSCACNSHDTPFGFFVHVNIDLELFCVSEVTVSRFYVYLFLYVSLMGDVP